MERTSMPAAESARMADSRPEPGPDTRTSTVRTPWSRAMLAAFIAACCAANGVPLREPRKPSEPELFHDTVLPLPSEMVTMVLLNEARMCTNPWGTFLRSFFLNFLVLPFAAPAAAACAFAIFTISYGLCLGRSFLLVGNRTLARSLTRARIGVRSLAANRQIATVTETTIRPDFNQPLDVQRNILAEIAFYSAFAFDDLADAVDLFFAEVLDLLVGIDRTRRQNSGSPRVA